MPPDHNAEVHMAIGEHNAQIEALQIEVAALRKDVKDILGVLAEAKGGWKMLMLVGGAGGAVGAFLTKMFPTIGAMVK